MGVLLTFSGYCPRILRVAKYDHRKQPVSMFTRLLLLGLCFLSIRCGLAQPANDDFASRRLLSGYSVRDGEIMSSAGIEPGEPSLGHSKSLWWSWIAPENGLVTIEARSYGSPFGFFIYPGQPHVYRGKGFLFLNPLEDTRPEVPVVEFEAIEGEEYKIQLEGTGNEGSVNIFIDQRVAAIPLSPEFELDDTAGGYLFRRRDPDPFTAIPSSREAEALLDEWSKIPKGSNDSAFASPTVGHGLDYLDRGAVGDVGEVVAFVNLPAGEHTFVFGSAAYALYGGANHVLIAEGQTEVTLSSPGGVFPFRLTR